MAFDSTDQGPTNRSMRSYSERSINLCTVVALALSACGDGATSMLPREDLCGARSVVEPTNAPWISDEVTVTVLGIESGSKVEEFLGELTEWTGIVAELEVCAHHEALTLDDSFTRCEEYPAIGHVEGADPQASYAKVWPQDVQFREPVLDQRSEIPAGECRKGWLTFVDTWNGPPEEAPVPVAIVYEKVGDDGSSEKTVAWPLR